MKRITILAAATALLSLSACDKIRIPGVNPAEVPATTPQTPTPTEPPTNTGSTPDEQQASTPETTPETTPTPPENTEQTSETAAFVNGERLLANGIVYERRNLGGDNWMTIQIGEIAENDSAEGPYYDGTELRNGIAIANADAGNFREGDRFILDGALYERTRAEDGETWTITKLEDILVPQPTDVGDPAYRAASLAALNAVRCGLPTEAAPTPTVAAVAGATTLEEPSFGTAAVNAMGAQLINFPGIVKLEPRRAEAGGAIASGHCGATRIAENWLVTAAHCVDQPYEELRIIGEAENLRSPTAKVTDAQLAVCHAGYDGTSNGFANDIALLRLSPEEVSALSGVPIARFGATQKPLAPANYAAADMAGWGITRFGGQLSADLLTAKLAVKATGPALIYVASQGGAGPCIGDSGGPLYVEEEDGSKTMVGVLSVVEQNKSTGQFCSGDYTGRYTNLQGFDAWMRDVMTLCESDQEMCQ